MELSSQMLLYARVVESGSFSGAARALRQSPSAVSKQIGALEDRLGVRLLNRTQAGILMTSEGRAFYNRCSAVAKAVTEAETMVEALAGSPRGTLQVTATVAFGKAQILPLLPVFLERYPDIRIDLELTDRPANVFSEDLDLAIRFTEQLDDDNVIIRKIAPNRRIICAAPSYVARHGAPEMPSDLAAHNCLRLSTVARWNEWNFVGKDGVETVEVSGNFDANSADAVYHACLAGVGIARLSTYLVGDDVAAGRLVQLLPDHVKQGSDLVAVYSEKRHLAPKVRVFLDFLTESFGRVPPWERDGRAF